jgi:DNA-directed RNA polymerase specialized sigma24 family protein
MASIDQFERDRLVRYARVMVGADAEDAVQDVLIRCLELDRKGQATNESYRFRAVRLRCLDILKSPVRQRETPVSEWYADQEPTAWPVLDEIGEVVGLTPTQQRIVRHVMDGTPLRAASIADGYDPRHYDHLAHWVRRKFQKAGLTADVLRGVG